MIRAIFTDLGGVILTNGWDLHARQRAIERYQLERDEFIQRHEMVFGSYEEGRMSLSDYLEFVVFHSPRSFSKAEFIEFIYSQSQKTDDMLELLIEVKEKSGLPIFVISNEGREIAEYRIEKFDLRRMAGAFIVSGFVGMRKPALSIYSLICDVAQVKPGEALYIDDREYLIEAGQRAGLQTLWHKDIEQTRAEFTRHGLLG